MNVKQDIQEEVYRTHLKNQGCEIELNTELVSMEQLGDHVQAEIHTTHADGSKTSEVAQFPFLIGTDGARGICRKLLGLPFLGETRLDEILLTGDIIVEEGLEKEV